MKRKRVKIRNIDKNEIIRTIKTTVINDLFAVHGTLYEGQCGHSYDKRSDTSLDCKLWTLTHIPTGCAIATRQRSKTALIIATDKLLKLGDWNFTDPAEAQKRFDGKEVMAIIRGS